MSYQSRKCGNHPIYSFFQRSISSLLSFVFFTTTILYTFPTQAQLPLQNAELKVYSVIQDLQSRTCFKHFPKTSANHWAGWNGRLQSVEDFLKDTKTQMEKNSDWSPNEEIMEKFTCVNSVWSDFQKELATQAFTNPSCFPKPENGTITFQKDYRACEPVYSQSLNLLDRVVTITLHRYLEVGQNIIYWTGKNAEGNEANELIQQQIASFNKYGSAVFNLFNDMDQQIRMYKGLYFDPENLADIFRLTQESTNEYDSASPYFSETFNQLNLQKQLALEKINGSLIFDLNEPKHPEQSFFNSYLPDILKPKKRNPNTITVEFAKKFTDFDQQIENPISPQLNNSLMIDLSLSSIKHTAFQIWGDLLWKYGRGYFQSWKRKVPEDQLTDKQRETGKTYYYSQYKNEYQLAMEAVCSFSGEFGKFCMTTNITLDHGMVVPFRKYIVEIFDEFAAQQKIYQDSTPDELYNKRAHPDAGYATKLSDFNAQVKAQQDQCSSIHNTIQNDVAHWEATKGYVVVNRYKAKNPYPMYPNYIKDVLGETRVHAFKDLYNKIISVNHIGQVIGDEEIRKAMNYKGYDDDLMNCAQYGQAWNSIDTKQVIDAENRIRTTQLQTGAKFLQRNIKVMRGESFDIPEAIAEMIEFQPMAVLDFLIQHPSQEYAFAIAKHIQKFASDKRWDVIGNQIMFAFSMILLTAAVVVSGGWASPAAAAVVELLSVTLLAYSLVSYLPNQMNQMEKRNKLTKEALAIGSGWNFSDLVDQHQKGIDNLGTAQIMYWIQAGLAPLAFLGAIRNTIQMAQAERTLLQVKNYMSADLTPQAWDDLITQMKQNPHITFKEPFQTSPNTVGGYTPYPNMPVKGVPIPGGLQGRINEINKIKDIIRGNGDDLLSSGNFNPWGNPIKGGPSGGTAIVNTKKIIGNTVLSKVESPSFTSNQLPLFTNSYNAAARSFNSSALFPAMLQALSPLQNINTETRTPSPSKPKPSKTKPNTSRNISSTLNYGLPFQVLDPDWQSPLGAIQDGEVPGIGDPTDPSQNPDFEKLIKQDDFQKAISIVESGVFQLGYNKQICDIARIYANGDLGTMARKMIAKNRIDCGMYDSYSFGFGSDSDTSSTQDYDEEHLEDLIRIETIFINDQNKIDYLTHVIRMMFGKVDDNPNYHDEVCKLFENGFTHTVRHRAFDYIKDNHIRCYSKITVKTKPIDTEVEIRESLMKNFEKILQKIPEEQKKLWESTRDESSLMIGSPTYNFSNKTKMQNLFYAIDEMYRMSNLDDQNQIDFLNQVISSRGENLYSERDRKDFIIKDHQSQQPHNLDDEETEKIKEALLSLGTTGSHETEFGRSVGLRFYKNNLNKKIEVEMTTILHTIIINSREIKIKTTLQPLWENIKLEVDGYIYIPCVDNHNNHYVFKVLDPKYRNSRVAQDFFENNFNKDDLQELTDLIIDASILIHKSNHGMHRLSYYSERLWQLFYIAYDLREYVIARPVQLTNDTTHDRYDNNHDGLESNLYYINTPDPIIDNIFDGLTGLGFFINQSESLQDLQDAVSRFLDPPSNIDLMDRDPFSERMENSARNLIKNLGLDYRAKFKHIFEDMRKDEPEKLMYFFRQLSTVALGYQSDYNPFIDRFLQSDGVKISTTDDEKNFEQLDKVFEEMDSTNENELKSFIRIFTGRFKDLGLGLRRMSGNIYHFSSNEPFPQTYYLNLEEARHIDHIYWIPLRPGHYAERAEKYLQFNMDKPDQYKIIDFPTMRHMADGYTEEDRDAMNYYRNSDQFPSLDVPVQFDLNYLNQHLDGFGPLEKYHNALMHLINSYYSRFATTKWMIVPANNHMFSGSIDSLMLDYNLGRKQTFTSKEFSVVYDNLQHPSIRDYAVSSTKHKQLFVIRTSRSFPIEKNDEIQWILPNSLNFRVIKIFESQEEDGIDLIYLEQL